MNPPRTLRAVFGLRGIALMLGVALTIQVVRAGSATWSASPTSNDWNTAANWTPATVPNGPSDVATFSGGSDTTSVFITADTTLSRIEFGGFAAAYTITVSNLTLVGIADNSTPTQTFAVSGRLKLAGIAGKPQIHNLGASAAGGPAGITESGAKLDRATIINEGGTAPGAAGGSTIIAADEEFPLWGTLIANSGSNGGLGGTVTLISSRFVGGSFIANSGGTVDFSKIGNLFPNNPITVFSIEGAGDFFLANQGYPVVVNGGNGRSTTVSGVIHDGKNPLVGGVLVRSSSGASPPTTLSLTNANTYSGGTILSGDILEARHEGALGLGDVMVQHTIHAVTLTLQGAATNDYISDTAILNVNQSSVVNLNYTGAPEVVGTLVVAGVPKLPGLYGGPSSGAPNVVSEFQGTGTILVTAPSAVSRKLHGATNYYLSLPFRRPYAVECRSGGASNSYEVRVSFGFLITCNAVTVTSGTGTVTGVTTGEQSTIVITLSDVVSPQTLTLRLDMNYDGFATGSVFVPMNVVVGDVSGDGKVNATDVSQTKSNSGKALTSNNARTDVNVSGQINAGDVALVKLKSGTALPPATNSDAD